MNPSYPNDFEDDQYCADMGYDASEYHESRRVSVNEALFDESKELGSVESAVSASLPARKSM